MNANIIEAHLELHRQLMAVIKALVPKTKVGSFKDVYTLQEVVVDEEGQLKAEYCRYEGCGQYSYDTDYLDARKLFPEAV